MCCVSPFVHRARSTFCVSSASSGLLSFRLSIAIPSGVGARPTMSTTVLSLSRRSGIDGLGEGYCLCACSRAETVRCQKNAPAATRTSATHKRMPAIAPVLRPDEDGVGDGVAEEDCAAGDVESAGIHESDEPAATTKGFDGRMCTSAGSVSPESV